MLRTGLRGGLPAGNAPDGLPHVDYDPVGSVLSLNRIDAGNRFRLDRHLELGCNLAGQEDRQPEPPADDLPPDTISNIVREILWIHNTTRRIHQRLEREVPRNEEELADEADQLGDGRYSIG